MAGQVLLAHHHRYAERAHDRRTDESERDRAGDAAHREVDVHERARRDDA